ncbi:MAG: hypothetical protein RMJ53_05470, partial [Chitinophagales bacterium]|nr:hypothetical protein [Chitinophagales bacterium]
MSEAKTMRLAKAASVYNVSTAHIIEKLKEHGFDVEDKPTYKLTPEMEAVLEKEFNKDRAIKLEAESVLPEKTRKEPVHAPENIATTRHRLPDEEKEVIIRSNTAPIAPPLTTHEKKVASKTTAEKTETIIKTEETQPSPSPDDNVITTPKPTLEPLKIRGKIDLE